jgi:aquaporin Z
LIQGGWALQQLWLFWVAPIVGGVLGGLVYKALGADASKRPDITGEPLPAE